MAVMPAVCPVRIARGKPFQVCRPGKWWEAHFTVALGQSVLLLHNNLSERSVEMRMETGVVSCSPGCGFLWTESSWLGYHQSSSVSEVQETQAWEEPLSLCALSWGQSEELWRGPSISLILLFAARCPVKLAGKPGNPPSRGAARLRECLWQTCLQRTE